jgi:predicted metal-dependent phosphoesterase TrpH
VAVVTVDERQFLIMRLKTNLHLHSREDEYDVLDYSIFQAIDRAAELGYEVLAWTPHRRVLCRPEHIEYAKSKGIILFSGIEAKIGGREVLLIDCGPEAEKIKSFAQLKEYKKTNKDLLVVAPHPFFPAKTVLAEKLEEHIDLFDAVELSWFHTKDIDFNAVAAKIAAKHHKPFVATSDTHRLDCLERSYTIIDSEKDAQSIKAAIRAGRVDNFSEPITLLQAVTFMLWLDWRPRVVAWKIIKKFRRFFRRLGR